MASLLKIIIVKDIIIRLISMVTNMDAILRVEFYTVSADQI
jgi:hypothetical protein